VTAGNGLQKPAGGAREALLKNQPEILLDEIAHS